MKRELNLFFNALLFYTRIPVSRKLNFSETIQTRSFRYFPLVGIIVGATAALSYTLFHYIFPETIAILLALASAMWLTGALHEDGLADFFDGFGGGHSKEKILEIMKDSHIGTYGVLAILMMLLLKIGTLGQIPASQLPLVFITAHSVSRVYPLFLINTSVYVREGISKAQHARNKLDMYTWIIGTLIGLIPLVILAILDSYRVMLVFLPLSVLLFLLYRQYLHKRIGGFTGDTLGALQQIMEILFLLTYVFVSLK